MGESLGTVETLQGLLEVFAGRASNEPVPPGLIGNEQPFLIGEPRRDIDMGAGQVPLAYHGDLRQRAVFVHGTQRPFADQLQAMEIPEGLCMTLGGAELASGGAGVCMAGATLRDGIVNVGRFRRDVGVAASVVMDLLGIPLEPFTMRALDAKAELIELELIDPRAWLP